MADEIIFLKQSIERLTEAVDRLAVAVVKPPVIWQAPLPAPLTCDRPGCIVDHGKDS